MDDGGHLDHVLIAGQHERFVRLALEASHAMLRVPLIGRRLEKFAGNAFFLGSQDRAEAHLDRSHAEIREAREAFDRGRELVVKTRLPVRLDAASEARDDADLARLQLVDSAEHPQHRRHDQRRFHQAAPALPQPREAGGRVEVAEPVGKVAPPSRERRPVEQPAQAAPLPARPLDAQQAQRVDHYQQRSDLVHYRRADWSQQAAAGGYHGHHVDNAREDDDVLPDDRYRVAADLQQPGQFLEGLVEVDNVRGLGGDVGARAHDRDSHVRCGQCRSIVDTVSDHGYLAAFGLQLPDALELLLGQQPGFDVRDSDFTRNRFGGALAVARQQNHPLDAHVLQRMHRLHRTLARRIAQQNRAGQLAVGRHQYGRRARPVRFFEVGFDVVNAALAQECLIAGANQPSADETLRAASGNDLRVARRFELDALLARRLDDDFR